MSVPSEYQEICDRIASLDIFGNGETIDKFPSLLNIKCGNDYLQLDSNYTSGADFSFGVRAKSGYDQTIGTLPLVTCTWFPISTIRLSTTNNGISAVYDGFASIQPLISTNWFIGSYNCGNPLTRLSQNNYAVSTSMENLTFSFLGYKTTFTNIATALTYIEQHFRHINLVVDDDAWIDVTPPTYTWQSVPSISGKNGILQSLVQIKEEALNDGEPVSEATVLSFDSLGNINIPSVIDEQMPVDPSDVTSVTATYLIPALENGTYEGIKLLVKKGSIPTSEEDADKVVNLDEPTSILRIDSKSVGNLDEDSHYYFVVKLVDEIGTEATSDPKDIWTSHSEGWSFDYTGAIQTFTAPKTGIYSLETWGAQGGDATDGTNTARGGYGAYAYGEVLLQQGETIYINVGGQNGYGGGGNYTPPNNS